MHALTHRGGRVCDTRAGRDGARAYRPGALRGGGGAALRVRRHGRHHQVRPAPRRRMFGSAGV
jgi:hypothetical protein